MFRRILIFLIFLLIPALVGFFLAEVWSGLLLGGLLGIYVAALDWFLDKFAKTHFLGGAVGGGLGILCAVFLAVNVSWLLGGMVDLSAKHQYSFLVLLSLVVLLFAYLGIYAGSMVCRGYKQVDISSDEDLSKISPKMLDTSVIVDGRIADIIAAGFLEGTMLVPKFIIMELQNMADSGNRLKRERGRRGLDVLNSIREDLPVEVLILEKEFPNIPEVDSKLVAYSNELGSKIVTNDFNLNKVARLQGVEVLNINQLSNAVKPVFIPGETFKIEIIKEGEEENQGVGYLQDGTMVVVEEGGEYVGKKGPVTVTSVIQTSAGRMIFAQYGTEVSV